MKTCSRCLFDKPDDQFRAGKSTCRQCRTDQEILRLQERRDQERREAEADLKRILNWPVPGRAS